MLTLPCHSVSYNPGVTYYFEPVTHVVTSMNAKILYYSATNNLCKQWFCMTHSKNNRSIEQIYKHGKKKY